MHKYLYIKCCKANKVFSLGAMCVPSLLMSIFLSLCLFLLLRVTQELILMERTGLPCKVHINSAHLTNQRSSPSVVELGPLDMTWPDIAIWKSKQM